MTGGAELPWHCFNCLRLPPFLYPVGQQCGASRRSKQFDAAGNRPQRAGGRSDPVRSAPQGLTGEAGGSSRALPAAISYGGVGSAPPACWGYSYGLGTLGQNEAFELLDEELAGTSQRGRSIYLLSPQRTRGRAETIPTPSDEDAEIPPLIGSTWS